MGICINYDIKHEQTHPILLPKIPPDGLVSNKDIEILKQASGLDVDAKEKRYPRNLLKYPRNMLRGNKRINFTVT